MSQFNQRGIIWRKGRVLFDSGKSRAQHINEVGGNLFHNPTSMPTIVTGRESDDLSFGQVLR